MLTRKQLWRRAQTKYSNNSDPEFDQMRSLRKMGRAFSEPNENSRSLSSTSMGERVKSSNDIANKKRHVHFSDTSKVVLIPCRKEYHTHHLNHELWWENEDYHQFKRSATQEISHLLQIGDDIKTILKKLYQNNNSEI